MLFPERMSMEYRDVVGWEGFYEVRDDGVVRSIGRYVTKSDGNMLTVRCKCLSAYKAGKYLAVNLCRNGTPKVTHVHRIVAEAFLGPRPTGRQVDHIDRNRFNNAACNLRYVTPSQNAQNSGLRIDNTSGVKGVFWDKRKGKWIAQIGCEGKLINLGFYTSKDDAVAARLAAEEELGWITAA